MSVSDNFSSAILCGEEAWSHESSVDSCFNSPARGTNFRRGRLGHRPHSNVKIRTFSAHTAEKVRHPHRSELSSELVVWHYPLGPYRVAKSWRNCGPSAYAKEPLFPVFIASEAVA